MGGSSYQLAMLFKKEEKLTDKLDNLKKIFDSFELDQNITPSIQNFQEPPIPLTEFLKRKELKDGVTGLTALKLGHRFMGAISIVKDYPPFSLDKTTYNLVLFRSAGILPDSYYRERGMSRQEGIEEYIADEDYFEEVLLQEFVKALEPEYLVLGEPWWQETALQYYAEFSTNNWRLALSPHFDDLGAYQQNSQTFTAKIFPLLFDDTRPELVSDLNVLKEHLTETELRKLIKKYSFQNFEDNRGHIGTIRHEKDPNWSLYVGFPNFGIRRKLRREGVKLYFGLLELNFLNIAADVNKLCYLFEENKSEIAPFLKKTRASAFSGSWFDLSHKDETLKKVQQNLTNQEKIDFGL